MLKLKLQYTGHLMWRAYALEKILMLGKIECRRRREWQKTRWSDGITDSMDEFEQGLGDVEGQGSLVCCNPWGHKESDMIMDWTTKIHNSWKSYGEIWITPRLLEDLTHLSQAWTGQSGKQHELMDVRNVPPNEGKRCDSWAHMEHSQSQPCIQHQRSP